MNYLVLALTAYKAAAKAIFDRLLNVTMLTLQTYKNLNWSHQAICTLLRSDINIFLIQSLGKILKLKSNMLEKEESMIGGIRGYTPEDIHQNKSLTNINKNRFL